MKVSIVTATWNRGDTIRSTIESILGQRYQNWEHIIVDGASTDNTLDIVNEYAEQYSGRLKLISEPDNGIYDAMNKGIHLADGDIIGILNSDDFLADNGTLTRIVEALSDEKSEAVHGDCNIVDSNNLSRTIRRYNSNGFRRWKMRIGYMPAHPTFYCKRDVFEKYGDFDTSFKIAADFDWLLRCIYVGNIDVRYIPNLQTIMRGGGVSDRGWKTHRLVMKEHKRSFNNVGLWYTSLFELVRFADKYGRKVLGMPY